MKKTILAIAIPALFASAANAAVIYEQDGVTLALEGAAKVQFQTDIDSTDGLDNKNYINVKDGDFGFGLAYDLGHNFKVGGKVSYELDSDDENKLKRKDLYVGLMGDFGTFTFGRQVMILDSVGVGQDKEFGYSAGVEDLGLRADQVVKYELDTGMFFGGISYLLNADGEASESDTSAIDGKLGFRTNGFTGTVYYGQGDEVSGTYDETTFVGVEAVYAWSSFEVGAGYYDLDVSDDVMADYDTTSFGLTAAYMMDAWTFAAGWGNSDPSAGDKSNQYYVNAQYDFSSNVNAFAELGFSDADDTRTGYVVGMSASF